MLFQLKDKTDVLYLVFFFFLSFFLFGYLLINGWLWNYFVWEHGSRKTHWWGKEWQREGLTVHSSIYLFHTFFLALVLL